MSAEQSLTGLPVVGHDVRCVVDSRDKLGESAIWSAEQGALYWLDVIPQSWLHRLDHATSRIESWPMPEMISAMATRADGTLLIASHGGINIVDPATRRFERVATPEQMLPFNRSNDGAPDAKGRFWIGTMQNNVAPDGSEIPLVSDAGNLWRIDADFSVTKIDTGFGVTNGVVWSSDNRTLYVSDTPKKIIYAYDFDLDAGTATNRRIFASPDGPGLPDGAAIDAEGYLWSARWEGGALIRFSPDGVIDRVVPIPAERVTSCAFGGPDLATLYVTTSRQSVSAESLERHPQQGGLFAFEPGVKGLVRPRFGG